MDYDNFVTEPAEVTDPASATSELNATAEKTSNNPFMEPVSSFPVTSETTGQGPGTDVGPVGGMNLPLAGITNPSYSPVPNDATSPGGPLGEPPLIQPEDGGPMKAPPPPAAGVASPGATGTSSGASSETGMSGSSTSSKAATFLDDFAYQTALWRLNKRKAAALADRLNTTVLPRRRPVLLKKAFFPMASPYGMGYAMPVPLGPMGLGYPFVGMSTDPSLTGAPPASEDVLKENYNRRKELIMNLSGQLNPQTGLPYRTRDIMRLMNNLNAVTNRVLKTKHMTDEVYKDAANRSLRVGRQSTVKPPRLAMNFNKTMRHSSFLRGVKRPHKYGSADADATVMDALIKSAVFNTSLGYPGYPNPYMAPFMPGVSPSPMAALGDLPGYSFPQGSLNLSGSLNPSLGYRPGRIGGAYSGFGMLSTPFGHYGYRGGYAGGYGYPGALGYMGGYGYPGAFGGSLYGGYGSQLGGGPGRVEALMRRRDELTGREAVLDESLERSLGAPVTRDDLDEMRKQLFAMARKVAHGGEGGDLHLRTDPLTNQPLIFANPYLIGSDEFPRMARGPTDAWKDFATYHRQYETYVDRYRKWRARAEGRIARGTQNEQTSLERELGQAQDEAAIERDMMHRFTGARMGQALQPRTSGRPHFGGGSFTGRLPVSTWPHAYPPPEAPEAPEESGQAAAPEEEFAVEPFPKATKKSSALRPSIFDVLVASAYKQADTALQPTSGTMAPGLPQSLGQHVAPSTTLPGKRNTTPAPQAPRTRGTSAPALIKPIAPVPPIGGSAAPYSPVTALSEKQGAELLARLPVVERLIWTGLYKSAVDADKKNEILKLLAHLALFTAGGAAIGGTVGGTSAPQDYMLEGARRGGLIGGLTGGSAVLMGGLGKALGRRFGGQGGGVAGNVLGSLAGAGLGLGYGKRDVPPWETGEIPLTEQIGQTLRRRAPAPEFVGGQGIPAPAQFIL
jgi:hypothetical protein